jgi:hypothetical protein
MKTAFSGKAKLLSAAAAALFSVTAYSALADNSVKAGAPYDKPGRTIDDTVKAPGNPDRPGRALEAGNVTSPGKATRAGRAVDESTVTSKGATNTPGRTADEDVVKSGGKRMHARAIDDVKAAGKTTETQGRTLDESKNVKTAKKTSSVAGRAVDEATVKAKGPSDKASRALKKE